jgi:hypothetical protein
MPKRRNEQMHVTQEELDGVIQEIENSSDRAAAIVGAATLDALLEHVIRWFLIEDERGVNELFDNEPLDTFSAKIKSWLQN